MQRFKLVSLVACLSLTATPALAITARDVMEKMEQKERYSYLTGLIDMMSYQALLGGDRTRAECISNAFYKRGEMPARILETFGKHLDKAPEGLVVVLMKRECGG